MSFLGRKIGPPHDHEKFTLVGLLGIGQYAEVYAGRTVEGTIYAIKKPKNWRLMRDEAKRRTKQEIQIHQSLHHPNIIKLFEHFKFENEMYIVLGHAPGGTLKQHVKNYGCLPEIYARFFFQKIISAMEHVHSKGIAHGDLKLDNILLSASKTEVFVADYGFSQNIAVNGEPDTAGGTLDHMAPEVLMKTRYPWVHRVGQYNGKAADVYALGVCVHDMLMGKCPVDIPFMIPKTQVLRYIKDQIQNSEFDPPTYGGRFHVPPEVSVQRQFELTNEVKDLLRRMLDKNPESRITLQEIKQHPWLLMDLPRNWVDYSHGVGIKMNLVRREEGV